MNETQFIAFSTQKGGVGKTVLTVLVASYLHYVKGVDVAVIDCDFPQHSIHEMRKRDIDLVMNDDYYKKMAHQQFTTLKRNAYTVVDSSPVEAINAAQKLLENQTNQPDIILFDLPGTLNTKGIAPTIAAMDYIFTPISADRVVLESSLTFAATLNENIISVGKGNIKGLHLLWNMVDARERGDIYASYDDVIAELGLQILKTTIPDRKRFRHELSTEHKPIVRSTLFPIHRTQIKGSNIDHLVDELCSVVGIDCNRKSVSKKSKDVN